MVRRTLLWCLAAIAGVVLVAGVTYAASGLSTQAIGLSSEPLSAGEALAPKATATASPAATLRKAAERRRKTRPRATATPTGTPTPPPVVTAAPTVDAHGSGIEPSDDSGGHGSSRGSGGGKGSDD